MAAATFTRLLSMPDRPELKFDQNILIRRYPVEVKWEGFGSARQCVNNGLSFDDYRSMYVKNKKLCLGRRGAPPEWVMDYSKLRDIITWSSEVRAGYRSPQPGTHLQRLNRLSERNKIHLANLKKVLDRLCKRYVELKSHGPSVELKRLEIEIRGVDCQLCILKDDSYPKLLASVLFSYYRLGLDSPAIGNALGLRPFTVRQLLSRTTKLARKGIPPTKERVPPAPVTKPRQPRQPKFRQPKLPHGKTIAAINRERPLICEKCLNEYIPGRRGKMPSFCSRRCGGSAKRQGERRKRQFLCQPCRKDRDTKRRVDSDFSFVSQFTSA